MKAVQNEDKTWSVIGEKGNIRARNLKSRAEAREKIKALTANDERKALERAVLNANEAPEPAPTSEPEPSSPPEPKPNEDDAPLETYSVQGGDLSIKTLMGLSEAFIGRYNSLVKSSIPKGLTAGQASVLEALHGVDCGASQKYLSKTVGCTPGNMTMLIDNLVKGGFVERENDPVDRRRVLVTLTKDGSVLAKQSFDAQSTVEAKLFEPLLGMPEEKVKGFAEVLCTLTGDYGLRSRFNLS